jgi:hypothetical protein
MSKNGLLLSWEQYNEPLVDNDKVKITVWKGYETHFHDMNCKWMQISLVKKNNIIGVIHFTMHNILGV